VLFDSEMSAFKIFDSHFHIIDKRFPLVPNEGYLPDEFSCEDYLGRTKSFHLAGGAIVSGSFQAFDQTYLMDALQKLGPCSGCPNCRPGSPIRKCESSMRQGFWRSASMSSAAGQKLWYRTIVLGSCRWRINLSRTKMP